MITCHKLFNKPGKLKRFTGLDPDQFTILSERLDPLWQQAEHKRLFRPDRQRSIGAGRRYHLTTVTDKLLLILMWYRLYVVYDVMSWIFDLDTANISRLITKLTPLVEQVADPTLLFALKNINKGRKKIGSFEEFATLYPDLVEIVIDATEQKRRRPTHKKKQKNYYSGKKHMHSFKTQITVTKKGRIVNVSRSYPGRVHDKTILMKEQTIDKLPPEIKKYLDRGYQKINKEYPDDKIILPIKKHRWKRTLTRSQKIYNTKVAKVRIKVEHVLSRMKKYTILSTTYRSNEKHYNRHMRNIAALCNFRLQT